MTTPPEQDGTPEPGADGGWPAPPPPPGYGAAWAPRPGSEDPLSSGPEAFGLPGEPLPGGPDEAEAEAEAGERPTMPGPTSPRPSPPPGSPYPSYGPAAPAGPGAGGAPPVRPARPRSVGLLVAGVVVLLVLGVAGVAVATLRRSGPEPSTALPTATVSVTPPTSGTPTTVPPSTPAPATPAPATPSTSSSSGAPRTTPTPPAVSATRPGWTAVAGRELVAYDVPPGWSALSAGTLTGFETSGGPKQLVVMHNAAAYRDDACPDASSSSRGQAGFVAWKGQPASTVARDVSRQWATVAGTQDDGSVMPLSATTQSRTTVAGGTIPATVATTTLTLEDQPSCAAPRIDFTAVAFQVKGQQVIFMIYLDRGVADEVTSADRDAVIASLRPV